MSEIGRTFPALAAGDDCDSALARDFRLKNDTVASIPLPAGSLMLVGSAVGGGLNDRARQRPLLGNTARF
jgi:hypothetical protein